MPTEVRVLGATALSTALLVFIAWWIGQHHDALVQHVHEAQTVTVGVLPSFSWSEPPRALPTMTPDAGLGAVPDAGDEDAMEGTEAELAAILIPAICNRRRNECGCTEYPSRFAPEEERIAATTCEQDTLRDFRSWWRNNGNMRARLIAEPEFSSVLSQVLDCSSVGVDAALLMTGGDERLQAPSDEPMREVCPLGMIIVTPGDAHTCVNPGGPCTTHNDCGFDQCVSDVEHERRCVPYAWQIEDPGDHAGVPCGESGWCVRGEQCLGGECVPIVGEGERCEHAICGRLTACETIFESGHCLTHACLTTHPFRGSAWSDSWSFVEVAP